MAYQFSLILNRELTESETATLKEATGADLSFVCDTLPTNAEVPVTRIDFADEVASTLVVAIESGFAIVKEIPELSIPGLRVPAQPAVAPTEEIEELAAEQADAVS